MSDLGKDNFEEFLRNSLEDYSSNDSPNWDEMESRLDAAQGGASSGSGILSNPLTKWIAAIVVVGGLSVFVANLLNNNGEESLNEDGTTQDSFISRMRALTLADDKDSKVEAGQDLEANESTDKSSLNKNNQESESQMSKSEGTVISASDDDQVVYTQMVPPTVYEASGAHLDMLRKTYEDKDASAPDPIAEFDTEIKEGCVPLRLTFELESHDIAMKYRWDFGDGTVSTDANPVHVFRETGSYNVALTVTSLINQKYVTAYIEEPVIVYGLPDIDFQMGDDLNEAGNEISFVNYSSNVIEWAWSFGDGATSEEENPKHVYSAVDNYVVTLIGKDANGCKDTSSSTISIIGKQLIKKIFAPNSFSPNGDGRNDEFYAKINGPQTLDFKMIILNRGGRIIFETDDINQAWDGRLNGSGSIAPQGLYIWEITFRDGKGNQERIMRTVNLFR